MPVSISEWLGQPPAPAMRISALSEQQLIQNALSQGHRNESYLTNIVFFARHPERKGRALQSHERELLREWVTIRDRLARPALARAGMAPTAAPLAPRPACPHPESNALMIEMQAARVTLHKSARVAEKFYPLLGGLDARGRFTRTVIDNKYWFAKLYELITYEEISGAGRFEHPAFVMHFIPIFYDMYSDALHQYLNRAFDKVPAHWMRHFRVAGDPKASSVSGWINEVRASIVTGVAAHIKGDMAQALERAYRSYVAKYCLPKPPFDSFRRDFFENNRMIFNAVKASFVLVLTRNGPFPVSPEIGQFVIGAGEKVTGGGLDIDEIYRWRAEAWDKARALLSR